MGKHTYKYIKNYIESFDYKLISDTYINNRSKLDVKCKCGNQYKVTFGNFREGGRCSRCRDRTPINKRTLDQFIKKSKQVHGNTYAYDLVEYINNSTKVKIICPIHDVFEQRPSSHLQGHGCSNCARKHISKEQTKTTDQFITEAIQVHKSKYDYSLVRYTGAHTKVKIVCPTHGVFEQNAISHLQGHGCSKCAYESNWANNALTTEEFISKASLIHSDKYDYTLVEYINSKIKVKIICPIHGMFEQTPDTHMQQCGCPKCSLNISHQELELQEWLSQYIDIKTNSRGLINPFEIDIIIHSKKIAIEYNGLYWHSENAGKDKNYHSNKYNLCKEKGYRLIQVWENEWLLKKDIVKSILLSAIGLYDTKIGARQCSIVDIDSKVARVFYDNNHIQGFKGGNHKGLIHKDELLSLMTIDGGCELQRFANKLNHQVYGSFSKLLNSFNDVVDTIITFADLRYFTGDVYVKNGFTYDGNVSPQYWYFKHHTLEVIHRRRFQSQYLKKMEYIVYDDNITEYQNMVDNGYHRIWDCGKIRFIKKGYR